jgi:hypothetical protein
MTKHHHGKKLSAKRIAELIDRVRRCTLHDIIEEIEELLDRWERGTRHHAHHLAFTFNWSGAIIKGEHMTFTMPPLNAAGKPSTVTVIGSPVTAQLDANGNPIASKATLSSPAYTSSDPTIFSVTAPDPAAPLGAILTAVATPPAGTTVSATLTEIATATEPDGTTTEKIQGVATIVIAAPAVVPPPAAALVFTFGTPQ